MRFLILFLFFALGTFANAELYLGLRSERTIGDGHSFGTFAGDWDRVILDIDGQSFARVVSEAELITLHETPEAAYEIAAQNSESIRDSIQISDVEGLNQLISQPNEAIGGLFLLDGFADTILELTSAQTIFIGQPVSFAVLIQNAQASDDPVLFGETITQYASTLQGGLDNQIIAYSQGAFSNSISATYPTTAKEILMSLESDPENTLVITLKDGDVVMRLRDDLAPNHVTRIKQLAREGFYDGIVFHRVIDGFMAQTGDPTGTGTSGSGQNLNAEFSDAPFLRGTVGMARAASPNSADSQFFIMFDEGRFLDGNYTVIGQVETGMEFVDNIKRGEPPVDPDQMMSVKIQADL